MITDELKALGNLTGDITVSLSNELVQLLSDQLYSSPLKAIEELIVNSYDADAKKCSIFIPNLDGVFTSTNKIVVFDNGEGMNVDGLANLWQIGRSNKRTEEISKRSERKQIGKFGIGKLATYSVANEITYISKSKGKIHSVSLDYSNFSSSGSGAGKPIVLPVLEITNEREFYNSEIMKEIIKDSCIEFDKDILTPKSWTIVILQKLKPKATDLKLGRLKWILSTAMPLNDDFSLSLNCEEIESSKSSYNRIAEFNITEMSDERLIKLRTKSGENWEVVGDRLICTSFPSGVKGKVFVTERSLQEGKSADLGRSNGFFVKVRERLVNIIDKDFGITLSSTETFARFRAEIEADDLDSVITAPREGIETSELKERFQELLSTTYNEARNRYEEHLRAKEKEVSRNKEGKREHVLPHLVEHPIADAISISKTEQSGTEADDTWFYFNVEKVQDLSELAVQLYSDPRERYTYKYLEFGRTSRLVEFDAKEFTFFINEDHEFVKAHSDNARSKILLEDIVTAEALLEIYLRERDIPHHIIGEVLEKRDKLLRSLAKDHPYSNKSIASELSDAASNDHDLEVNFVIAMRAMGFTAKHIAGANEPDGIARFTDSNNIERVITLEAKSSKSVPQLSQLDFAGLKEHVTKHNAHGCLLLAPSYPGMTKEADSSASIRAIEAKISCWTVDQMQRVLLAAEGRHINAKDIYEIVISKFAPDDVTAAVSELLSNTKVENRSLYIEIINALKAMKDILPDSPRNIHQIGAIVGMKLKLNGHTLEQKSIEKALRELSGTSRGGLILNNEDIIINVSLEELERRAVELTGNLGQPLEESNFRR